MKDRLIKELDSADLYLRDRALSDDAPLNEYDVEAMLDIAKICDEAARCLENAILLPCKVGDTVYRIFNEKVVELQVIAIPLLISTSGAFLSVTAQNGRFASISLDPDDFGKTVFLSREEAEAALKKDEGK